MALVSIGVPTFNGVQFIAECLRSLQEQTFEDFEVVISDNGSTDGTSDICADFARHDPRFRHNRLNATIPSADNFCRVRDLTTAPYFMWRADDDLAEATHLAGLVKAITSKSDAVLAVSPILRISEQSTPREKLYPLPRHDAATKAERIHDVLLGCHPSWFYGLWDRRTISEMWNYVATSYAIPWASDHLTILPAILDEKVAFSDDGKFIQRISRTQTYHLKPGALLSARNRYQKLAREMIAQRQWTPAEIEAIEKTLQEHINLRVAPLFTTWRRYLLYMPRMALKKIKGKG